MFRRCLPALLLASTAALAVPTESGAPRRATEVAGCAVSGFGSTFALKTAVTGARSDLLGALTLHDARTGARANQAYGTFSLAVSDLSGPRFTTRAITYDALGWSERSIDGAATARVQVLTLAEGVFGISLSFEGLSSAVTVRATLDGTVAGGSAELSSDDGVTVTLTPDPAEDDPFAVVLRTTGTSTLTTGTGGTSYTATLEQVVGANATVGFLLAFDTDAAAAQSRGTNVLSSQSDPAGWRATADSAWQGFLAAHTSAQVADAALDAADALALSVLWHNEVGALGALPAKTALNYFETRDTGFISAAAAEHSSTRAVQILDGVLRGQRPEGTAQAGLIPHRVDAQGASPSLGVISATNDYSERSAFWLALRALQSHGDRALTADEQTRLAAAMNRYLRWWRDHRDWDEDLVPEGNGGLEIASVGSPRLEAIWGEGANVDLPVPFADPVVRTPLNAADIAASVYADAVETSQLAGAVGDEALQRELIGRANLLALQIDEDTFGHWDDGRGGFFDYWLDGPERVRTLSPVRSPTIWAPLTPGAPRELPRLNRALGHLRSEAEFWRPHGIPSLAIGEASFDPNALWRGAAMVEQQYEAMLALYRYGYEAEAEQLRGKLLQTLATHGRFSEAFNAETGDPVGTACFGTAAAVYVAAARNRHQADAFLVERGELPRQRSGAIRRLFRLREGTQLLSVSVPGSREVPVTTLHSDTQLFSVDPMSLSLADPHGVVGDATVKLELPTIARATVRWTAGPNAGREERLDGVGATLEARVGDRIEMGDIHYVGEQTCRCGAGGFPLLPLAGLLLAELLRRRRR